MDALTVLTWLGVIFAGLLVFSTAVLLALVIWAASLGLRKMRDDEDEDDKSIFTSGGRS